MTNHVEVIAEIGINHNGDLATAHALIAMAYSCGVDAVKFQKRTVDLVYSDAVQRQPRASVWGTTVGDQKHRLEFGEVEYRRIDDHCRALGIKWFGSAWDVESVHFLEGFFPTYHKIASPLLRHSGVLETVASLRRPTFISTGMSEWADVDRAIAIFEKAGCAYTLMHTVSVYPCPELLLNLRMVRTLQDRYPGVPVGYSGHEVSPMPTILAMGVGAVAVERHITLDRAMVGSDQAASLERAGLAMVVGAARAWEGAAGDGVKRFLPEEQAAAAKLRYWERP